jgi:hypothetical protein
MTIHMIQIHTVTLSDYNHGALADEVNFAAERVG